MDIMLPIFKRVLFKGNIFQAWGGDVASLARNGAAIASIDGGLDRIVVKLPLTREGVAAAKVPQSST